MNYYLNLFSPDTYEAFSKSTQSISGFSISQHSAAKRIHPKDRFICYLTRISRWIGVFEVCSECFVDHAPIFKPEQDPFIVRFQVRPMAWLPLEKAIPIRDSKLWEQLSFTKDHDPNSSTWTGKLRGSLTKLSDEDAAILERLVFEQAKGKKEFPLTKEDQQRLRTHTIRRADSVVEVTVPDETEAEDQTTDEAKRQPRESIKVQATLAKIGLRMGMQVWIPRGDRSAVAHEGGFDVTNLLEILPLNYESLTLRTIEQIDVLWLRGRSICRAFEVEHTTSVYSGILRMADLVALQPNLRVNLHIVAPPSRRHKVFQELGRPVFSVLEGGPLSKTCTYLSYENVELLAKEKHLDHLSDTVLDEYAEEAE